MSEESVKLSLRIDEARDVSALQVLAEHAARHGDREVQALRFKAINKMRQLRNGAGGPHFAAPYGIMATRDIALHGYRLADEAFARLQADVAAMAAQGRLEQGYCPALFVLWAADWFRRCYRGNGLQWDRLTEALSVRIDQGHLRDVTEKGLRHWRRPFKTSDGDRRYFLGTLALEGGFPVAAVEQGGKGWANDNLLSELSVRAVLPGHGFPTNVVPFVASDKPLADEAAGDDRSARRRSHPTRNLDIAIRDYAPGAEVVVDGLVYRSAGVTLNWQRPVDADKVREVQSIQTFWACPTCGAADCAPVPPQHCPACHAILPTDDSAQRRFLEPSGFTADMGAKPHAETDMVSYVEPEAEQIVARGAAWLPFADPAQGRMRFSHDGLVFYSSRGATRKGYDVCLECGRAEAATDGMDRPLKDHKPLRHSRADAAGLCPGNDLSFKILYGIALGHQTLTDVAEMQPVGLEEDGVAWALLSALRQALARRLGVETGELGMAVRPAWTPIGQRTHSLYLFDRASGGAGFAPQAVPLYDRLLRDAVAILDCQEPGCVRGCSACVLTGDLYRQQDRIDRTGALAWAKSALAALGTVASDDAIAADAQLSRSAADDLVAMLDQGARTLTIWIEGESDVAALGEGALSLVARRAADRDVALHLVVDPVWIGMLDPAARLALRDFAKTRTIILRQGTAPRFANDAIGIAAADGRQPSIWASRDKQAARLGPYWGLGQDAPVVRSAAGRLPLSALMDPDSLLPVSGTQFIELGQALDGPIADFGRKLVDALLPAIRAAGGTGVLARIDYNDRYLQSPLVIRLMAEAMAALRDALAGSGSAMDVRLITNRFKCNERQPFAPDHDWQWEEDRADVLDAVLAAKALTATLVQQGAAHGRVMTLSFVGGAVVRLVLDQGFGPWRTPSYAKFDLGVDAQRQADRLMAYSALIAARGGGYVVVTA